MPVSTLAALLSILDASGLLALSEPVLATFRWLAIATIVGVAVRRRSLTTWILVSMVVGAEIIARWEGEFQDTPETVAAV